MPFLGVTMLLSGIRTPGWSSLEVKKTEQDETGVASLSIVQSSQMATYLDKDYRLASQSTFLTVIRTYEATTFIKRSYIPHQPVE